MDALLRFGRAAASALEFTLLRYRWRWVLGFVCALLFIRVFCVLFLAPDDFPRGSIVVVPNGSSTSEVARELDDLHVVRHALVLRLVLRFSGGDEAVHAGAYRFGAPLNVFSVARRLATGAFGIPPVRITFTEGMTVRDMAAEVGDAFSEIPETSFLSAASSYEGYLFPDTYLFSPSTDAASMIGTLRANFAAKTSPLISKITESGHSLSDIVIMASLIEKEARSPENQRLVAGVLWNRIKKNMPLQVDAVFGYIYGRDTYSPSLADLSVTSPYNTYTHRGLPPGPIDNPGLASMEAALNPTETKYLYYLTGKDGLMHYATTYAEQLANQKKYLR